MEQHPVPQPISTYQFRLVGDMTLRQFAQVAGGVLVALLFYSLPIASYFKWPLVIFFGLLGFAIAFVPIEDRPLDKWIVSFIKSIFAPTLFVWQQQRLVPDFLKDQPKKPVPPAVNKAVIPQSKEELNEYLQTLTFKPQESKSEAQDRQALDRINALFDSTSLPASFTPQPKRLDLPEDESMPEIKIKPRRLVVPPSEPVTLKGIATPYVVPNKTDFRKEKPAKREVNFKIRQRQPVKKVQAEQTNDLPIPTTPREPNIIIGMIVDSQGKIIENAIIEIRNQNNLPVRALRTNQLGQFQIVTSLPNGPYEIEVEKEGFTFDIIKINLTGQVVNPIEIRAK